MDYKNWYKSRTIWIAIIAGALGVASAFEVVIPQWVFAVLTSMGLYTARSAKEEIK